MTLGQRIHQLRNSVSLSQEAFGGKLGATRQTISKWELDQAVPEITKIVMMSRIFHVTTDSLLVEGISTFSGEHECFACGVYKSAQCEVVETELFALVCYSSQDGAVMGTRLYLGSQKDKLLHAICEYNRTDNSIGYAYYAGAPVRAVCANEERLKDKIVRQTYDRHRKKFMKQTETFYVNHYAPPMPTVTEAGIRKCLTAWRMSDGFTSDGNRFHFWLCTGRTEYTFSIAPKDTDIYCGITYTIPLDLGLMGGKQFFRIRNYQDNSKPWCQFYSDLGYEYSPSGFAIPADKCELGKCIQTSQGILWGLKRYTDDQIVLQGCGSDEYIYNRNDKRDETFYF